MPSSGQDWFSNEDFWVASYGAMFPEERFRAADREVDQIFKLIGQSPRRVLDVACGPGRHAIPLARRGLTVIGVDRSEFLLDKARGRAANEGVDVEWVLSDMRDHVQDPAVDLVLNLFTSFGYFDDDGENELVLRNAYESLRPGGIFVLDVGGKEVLARIFSASSARDIPGGMIVHRREVTNNWSRMENEWIYIHEGSVRTFHIEHWIYSARELEQMLVRAGFSEVRLYGNFEGAPYDTEAARLVAVSTRK